MEFQDRPKRDQIKILSLIALAAILIIVGFCMEYPAPRVAGPTARAILPPAPDARYPQGRAGRPVKGPGEITNVVDGDTMDAFMDIGLETYRKIRIRLAGVDTPEARGGDEEEKKKAAEATSFVKERILGKNVMIIVWGKDSFGRYIAEIWYTVDHGAMKNLSDELLAAGLAEIYKK